MARPVPRASRRRLMLDEQLTMRRRLSRARVFTVGALSVLTAAGTGLGLVARADPGDPPGTIRTIAGVTTNYRQRGFSGDGGKATDAQLYNPQAVAFSKTGGNTIVEIDLKANPLTITRVAGNHYNKRYGGDGKFATDAQLNTPEGVWAVPDGTVYISDSENNLVRKVTPDGKIATVAGDVEAAKKAAEANQYPIPADSAGDGGPATAAHLNGPRGIAADGAGNLFVAEEGGARIRRIDPSGIITTIAGNGQANPDGHNPKVAGDPGPSPAMEAQFNTIHDLNLDKDGNLWIADSKHNRIRVVFDPAPAPAVQTGAGASLGGCWSRSPSSVRGRRPPPGPVRRPTRSPRSPTPRGEPARPTIRATPDQTGPERWWPSPRRATGCSWPAS